MAPSRWPSFFWEKRKPPVTQSQGLAIGRFLLVPGTEPKTTPDTPGAVAASKGRGL